METAGRFSAGMTVAGHKAIHSERPALSDGSRAEVTLLDSAGTKHHS